MLRQGKALETAKIESLPIEEQERLERIARLLVIGILRMIEADKEFDKSLPKPENEKVIT